jgi:ligand-binding SRPBCC domain-containing protein
MPRMPVLERSCVVRAPIDEVFAFHLDTRNAARISPRTLPVVDVRGSFPLHQGDVIEIVVRIWPTPFRQTWRIRAERVERPTLVLDTMLSGPFACWLHEHRFEDLGDGSTRLTDRIDYRLPFGVLGSLADRLLVRHLLGRTFAFRQRRSRELLERAG